jgi:tetratricopeptide (TPR) repeat protein
MRAVLVLLLLAVTTASAAPRARRADRAPTRIAQADKADAKKSEKSDRLDKPGKTDQKKADKTDAKKADARKAGEPPPPPAPRKPGPDDAKVTATLDKIVAGADAAARKAAIEELGKLAPTTVEAIGEGVVRPHHTEQADRRKVLAEIKAAVPDKTGRFNTPPRQTGKEMQADDDIDWLKALLELDAGMTGVGEVIADVAAIRALAATKDLRAAAVMFDIAFGEDSIIYRDEVGRYLRKMEPYSVPALIREAQIAKDPDRRRYGTWQLERIDRQDPLKALSVSAGDERLMVGVLDAFRATKLREAVHAVWTKVDDDSPRIRAAARAAWMDYITGPPPPPAPRKKLTLPGGKLTKKEKPLWLTYRELADTELRRAANELLHEDYPLEDETALDDKETYTKTVKIDLGAVTKQLFDHFDGERAKKEGAQWAAAKAKADAGDLETAAAMLDRLIATNPDRGERAEMAKVYARWGKQLEDKQQWAEASAAYSKAHGLDPKGPAATERLAAHHYALGKALESQGKDGGPDYRRAIALKPDYAPAQTAAERTSSSGRPTWMLFAAVAAAIAAMALFGVAMLRRRAA